MVEAQALNPRDDSRHVHQLSSVSHNPAVHSSTLTNVGDLDARQNRIRPSRELLQFLGSDHGGMTFSTPLASKPPVARPIWPISIIDPQEKFRIQLLTLTTLLEIRAPIGIDRQAGEFIDNPNIPSPRRFTPGLRAHLFLIIHFGRQLALSGLFAVGLNRSQKVDYGLECSPSIAA